MTIATPKVWKGEQGYLDLMNYVLEYGRSTPDRTGTGCIKVFNQNLWYDLREGFPASTVRPMSLRYGFEEFWMFLRGETDTTVLEERGINFWKGHTSREFLDGRFLSDVDEGDMGKAYGYQLRGNGYGYVDQLSEIVESLKEDPYSRRHIVEMWVPNDLWAMALTPCWHLHQFNVERVVGGADILHLNVRSRSSDILFGGATNTQQYALYLSCMAEVVGMAVGTLCCQLDDTHIYNNQIAYTEEVVQREIYKPPTLKLSKSLNSLEDMLTLQWGDITLQGLEVNKKKIESPKPEMAI